MMRRNPTGTLRTTRGQNGGPTLASEPVGALDQRAARKALAVLVAVGAGQLGLDLTDADGRAAMAPVVVEMAGMLGVEITKREHDDDIDETEEN